MKSIFSYVVLLSFIACNTNNQPIAVEKKTREIPIKEKQLIDLSHTYSDKTVYWVTAKEFKLDTVFKGETDKGYFYSANNFSTAEHGGTHIDAPIHFAKHGQSVDEIPLKKLIGDAIKINVSSKAMENPDYLITIEDFLAWEKHQGTKIPDGSIVLLQTNFSKYYPDRVKYLGTDKRGEEAVALLHFPGLSPRSSTMACRTS